MKKLISVAVALSMMMSMTFAVKAEDTVIDAYSAKITASQNSGIFKNNGVSGTLTGNKVALSQNGAAITMFQNVDFGENGVKSAVVDLAGDVSWNNDWIRIYAYPAGTAPFIDYATMAYRDNNTYKCEGGKLWRPNNGGEYENVGALTIDGTNVKFTGWNEGANAFEIPITGGNKLKGKYDIFVGANKGDFFGISFNKYEKTAYNSFAWNDYDYVSNENTVENQNNKLAFSNRASIIVYKNVDFGNVGIKSLNLEYAPGKSDSNGAGSNINFYLFKQGELYDNAGNLNSKYKFDSSQVKYTEDDRAVIPNKYQGFKSAPGDEWKRATYKMEIENGCSYRGVYDVVIGMNWGDYWGMTFEPIAHDTVSAYGELNANQAINLGDKPYNTQKHIKMTGGNNLVLYKNVDFGTDGASKIKLFVSSDTERSNMNMYLVKPEGDAYVDEIGRLNGYTVTNNSLKQIGANTNVGGTMWYNFTLNNNWAQGGGEITISFADANYNSNTPVTGVYDVYIGLTRGDFYGIQFLQADPAEDYKLDVATTEFSAKNYYKKTTYPSATSSTGVFGAWGNEWDHGANKRYVEWYADFGNTASLKTVDIYYGVDKDYANSYATIYADEIAESNIVARGVMKYQDGMTWGASNKYMTLPVVKELTGVHKLYLCVEDSPYDWCNETSGNPAGDITKFVFRNASNYTKIDEAYVGEQHSSLIFNKESNTKILHALAVYVDGNLEKVSVNTISPKDGLNTSELSLSTEDITGEYTVKSFVWNYENIAPIQQNQ